jgi:hypothetical protein
MAYIGGNNGAQGASVGDAGSGGGGGGGLQGGAGGTAPGGDNGAFQGSQGKSQVPTGWTESDSNGQGNYVESYGNEVSANWRAGSGPRNVYGTAEYCVLFPLGFTPQSAGTYTFYLYFAQTGTYKFSGSADNQAKFYIDDALAFEALNWGAITTGTYTVEAGYHKVGIYYYSDGKGGAGFGIQVDYPDNTHFWQTSPTGKSKNGSKTGVYQIVRTYELNFGSGAIARQQGPQPAGGNGLAIIEFKEN